MELNGRLRWPPSIPAPTSTEVALVGALGKAENVIPVEGAADVGTGAGVGAGAGIGAGAWLGVGAELELGLT
eukprot:5373367-Pyramimonas_sp.AAC.1